MTDALPTGTPPGRAVSLTTWWGDRRMRTKVVAPVAVAAVVAGSIGFLGLSAMADTQDRINALYADVTVPINDLGKIHASLEESNFLLSEMLLNTDPAALEQVQEHITTEDGELDELFAKYTATDMTGREEARDGFADADRRRWRSRSATAT